MFVPVPTRKLIDQKLTTGKGVDNKLFNQASKQVEQALRNDAYVRFLQSDEYIELFERKA